MRRRIICICIVLLLSAAVSAAVMEAGPADLLIDGGERGGVQFPHQRHQTVLGDCNICHDLFPQKSGSIRELINKNELGKKQVMNDHCIKCHRESKNAGKAAGPTTCSKCHIK